MSDEHDNDGVTGKDADGATAHVDTGVVDGDDANGGLTPSALRDIWLPQEPEASEPTVFRLPQLGMPGADTDYVYFRPERVSAVSIAVMPVSCSSDSP